MAIRTPNYQLFMNEAQDLVNEIVFDFQPDNMVIIDNNIKNIQDQATSLQNQINSITTTPAPTEQEIQIARNGYATLLESIQNAGINRTTSNPTVNSSGFTFWLNTATSELYVFKGGTAGAYEWERIDNNRIYELLENATDTEIILNENNLVQSHTPNFSGGIETKIEGKFIQNFMRNSNVISNTIVSDDSGSGIGINPDGTIIFGSNYSSSEQQLYIQNTHKYWVYVKANEGTIRDFLFFKYSDDSLDAIGHNTDSKEYYGIITATKTDTANFKLTEGEAGNISKANVIVLDLTEMGWDTMTADEVKSALGDLNGLEGTLPSKPVINVSGENLFDGKWDLENTGFSVSGNLKEFTITNTSTPNFKNVLPNLKFKPNTQYTFSGKCFETTTGDEETRLAIKYTDNSAGKLFVPTVTERVFNFTSDAGKSIDYIYIVYSSLGGVTTVKDFMIVKGTTAPTEYIPPKQSQFKLNDWLGDDETYENGLVTKQWGRVLLSEAWDGTFYNASSDLGSVYRFYLNLKRNYSEHSIGTVAYSYFKDFTFKSDYESDFKHQYLISRTSVNINRFLLFIPKQEIDNLNGNNLNDKFINWIKENDDYLYFEKAKTEQKIPIKIGLLTTFENELNTFSVSSDTVIPTEVSLKIKENLKSATGQQNNNVQQSVASLEELNNLILTKEYLNYDANNIAQEVQELRSDGSIFSKSILSGISPTYDRLVQTYYDENGNKTRELVFALTYNSSNKVVKKEVVS